MQSYPTPRITRTLSSEAVAAALKASPSLSLRTTNLIFTEPCAPPPSPVEFDDSPAYSVDGRARSEADSVSAEDWRRGKEEMRVSA
jgi:hypothetical protein